jgi:sugar lactone lactonase YvrE
VSILYTPTITGSPAPVSANVTVEVKVSYGQAPGSGNLWVANGTTNYAVVAFDSSQLSVSGSPTPAISILPSGGSLVTPSATAFDTSGKMWVVNPGANSLVAYNPAQIGASGAPAPAITILPDSQASLAQPFGMAFDASGYLWIVNIDSGNVVAYSPQQLQGSGAPVPAMILKSTKPFFIPEGIAFDAHGNLWVSSWTGNGVGADTLAGNLQEFTASQLTKAGAQTLTPAITLTGQGLEFVSSIAFDVSGNLWLTDDVDTIAQYSAAQLAAGGAQTPTVVIIDGLAPPCNFPPSPAPYCNGPDGLAFDNSGNLWVANGVASGTESIIKYTPSQLSQSGSPTPAVALTRNGTSIFGSVGLTFYPHASGLPIH